jgi:uncharacterized protein YbjT (DUF2867 family)
VRTYAAHLAVVPYREKSGVLQNPVLPSAIKGETMILVTGASGNAGRAVVDEMRKSSVPFRAMYRSEEDARNAPAGVSTVIADFASRGSMKDALTGVDSLYLVCSPIPALVELESNVIDASREKGVKHLVLNSALGAGDYPKSFPGWHRMVEDKLKASGLAFTILRPNSFMQNIVSFVAPSVRQQGAFFAAMGDARTSYLDLRDIAAVIARVLTSPSEHVGKTYELNGPEAVTYTELSQRIARVCDRPAKFFDIPEAAQRTSMLGMPEWQVDALLDLQRYYTNGQGGEVTEVLAQLLGRSPLKLDSFLKEFQDSFRSTATGA